MHNKQFPQQIKPTCFDYHTLAQQGMSLIEVIVAAVIMGTIMLAVTHVSISSFRGLKQSNNLTLAVQKMDDIAESIRANPDSAQLYNTVSNNPGVLPNCEQSCTPEQIITQEFLTLKNTIESKLYNPTLTVSTIDTTTNSLDVTLFWDDDKSGSDKSINCPPQQKADKDCYRITVGL